MIFISGCLLACALSLASPVRVGEVTLSIGQSAMGGRVPEIVTVQKGEPIFEGDVIKTSASGHVHVRFVDGALVSVRPNSVFAIHQFKYDPAHPSNSQVRLSLEAGEARSVSGAASQAAKDRFRLNTPLAAIGVKGTDFVTTAAPQSTRVTVHQGAIVMAPLDTTCRADSVGICAGSRARELTADMRGVALIYRSGSANPSFQSLPQGSDADKLRPTRGSTERESALVSSAGSAVVLPEELTSSKLVWGRWNQVPRAGDALTTDFRSAFAGNEITVGDGYYFLFRAPGTPNLLPSLNNQVEFKLSASSAQYRLPSNDIAAARVESGSFSVNFAQHTFDTQLRVSSAGIDLQNLRFAGKFDPNSGFFINSSTDPQVKLGGTMTLNGTQAGYFFLAPLGNGSISGATLWGR